MISPAIQQWLNALFTLKHISINASVQLANDVNALPASRSFSETPKQACPPPIIPSRTVDLRAADLLLALGKITTPRILNLVDLSKLWAYVRYAWAFEPELSYSSLRVSKDATQIDAHQKTIMSDDMGVAFATYVMEAFYDAPTAVDVSVALRNQSIPGLTKRYTTSPDYLFSDTQGNYFVVECKGTGQGRKPMLTQLRRGLEQVPSLIFPSRRAQPVRLVVGTTLARRSIEVYIIDPPASEEGAEGKAQKKPRSYEVKDERLFEQDFRSLRRANMFLFAGVTGKAIDALPHREEKERLRTGRIVYEPPTRIRSTELDQEFLGTRQPVQYAIANERVSVFQGILASAYRDIEEDNMEAATTAGRQVYQRAQQIVRERQGRETSSAVIAQATERSLRVDTYSKDGSMLRIEVEE